MSNCAYSQHYLPPMQTQYICWFSPQFVSLFFFVFPNFEVLLNFQPTGANSGFADLSESIYRSWQFCHLIILVEESTECQLVILFAG